MIVPFESLADVTLDPACNWVLCSIDLPCRLPDIARWIAARLTSFVLETTAFESRSESQAGWAAAGGSESRVRELANNVNVSDLILRGLDLWPLITTPCGGCRRPSGEAPRVVAFVVAVSWLGRAARAKRLNVDVQGVALNAGSLDKDSLVSSSASCLASISLD